MDQTLTKLLKAAVAVAIALTIPDAGQAQRYDIIISGGQVIDGTGSPPRRADIGIKGDRIIAVSSTPIPRSDAKRVIDARGRTVTPGFIDLHAHLDPLLKLPLAESALRQGVTTALGGPDGGSPLPLAPYMDSVRALKVGINVGYLVGHNDIRRSVMDMSDKAPTPAQLEEMKRLVAGAMRDGAFGLSTGLLYLPGAYSNIDEVVALAKVAADSGGIYTSHLRKEGIGLLEGVGEALEIGRRAGIPVVLTHHKAVGQTMWGKSVVTLEMVDSARRAGTDVLVDQYPYTATHTGIGVLIPSWAMAGGNAEFEKRLAVPALKDSIMRAIVQNILTDRGGGDISRVQFARVSWDKSLEGKTLADWARRRNMEPTPENGATLVLEAMLNGGANAIYHVLDEGDVRRIMTSPNTMIASDGRLSQPGEGHPHPRAYGTFPRVLGKYVREQKLMPLETAIYKMTRMPAKRLGLTDRGVLREGTFADLVIFDPRTVQDEATFTKPHAYPVGIETVIVNGVVAVANSKPTGARAGRVVLRPRRIAQSMVGYTQLTLEDSARSPRPVQISIWYPSPAVGNAAPMTLADYSRAITVEGTSTPVTPDIALAGARELEGYLASLGATREAAHNALAMRLSARLDPSPPGSPLPTVIFALGKDESAVIHADLAERIAANGFVVVTVPTVGTHTRATSWAAEDVVTHLKDLEFAIDAVARRGWSDTTRMAAIGYSYGSGAVMLLARRHTGMRALVVLDGSIAFRDRLSTFREALAGTKISTPLLYLGARNDARLDVSLLREIAPHAEVTTSDSTGHLDFTTLALVSTRPGFENFVRLGDDLLPPGVVYRRVTKSVIAFVSRYLI